MIKFIRKYSDSKISKILLGLLALAFIFLWGIGDVVRQFTNKNYIIKIGDEKIDGNKFNETFAINNNFFSKQDIQNETTRRKLIIEKTIQDLITKSLLNIFEKNNSMSFNKNVVSYAISKDNRFLDKNNQFDANKLKQLISLQNNSEEVFSETYAHSIKVMLLNMIFNGYKINDFYAAKLLESQYEKRHIEIKVFSPESFNYDKTPSEKELITFYEKNSKLFDVPELRTIEYICIDKNQINTKPTEDQIKKEFNKRLKSGEVFKEEYETLKSEIAIDLEDDLNYEYIENVMKEIQTELKNGKQLSDISKSYPFISFKTATFSKDNKDVNDKTVLNEKFSNILISNAFDTKKINKPSEFIDTEEGVELLFILQNIASPYTKPFEEVKSSVTELYIQEQKSLLAYESAKNYTDDIINGKNQKSIGKSYSYRRSDLNQKNHNLNRQAFIKIFNLKDGNADFVKIDGNYIVIKLIKSEKPNQQFIYEKIDTFKKTINKQLSNDLMDQFLMYSQTKNKLDVNKNALNFN